MAGSEDGGSGDDEIAIEGLESGDEDDEDGSVTASEQEETPAAVWDGADYVYRCVKCWGEIEDDSCFVCGCEHVRTVTSWRGIAFTELLFTGHRRKSRL
jgi:hypothetical protein